jgi:hypothetical protein
MERLNDVIKGLKCCPMGFCIPHCPYHEIGGETDTGACKAQLFKDAAEMLEAQDKRYQSLLDITAKLAVFVRNNYVEQNAESTERSGQDDT